MTASIASTMQVSVREARLVTERLLLTTGLPKGYIPAVRECVLVSQAAGLRGFAGLSEDLATLAAPFVDVLKHVSDGHSMNFDAGGAHAWVAMPTILDLAVAASRRHEIRKFTVWNVRAVGELACITHLAQRQGAAFHVELLPKESGSEVVVLSIYNTARPRTFEARYPLLANALLHGFTTSRDLWRSLYERSSDALAPDSVQSRRHAGPVIVLDDGTVVGRPPADDDFDPAMLLSVNTTHTSSPS